MCGQPRCKFDNGTGFGYCYRFAQTHYNGKPIKKKNGVKGGLGGDSPPSGGRGRAPVQGQLELFNMGFRNGDD